MRKLNRRMSAGFTLIELMVVIAIIGILIGLLLPVVGRIRENGRQVVCANNQRQIAIACMLYAEDNDGFLPSVWEGSWTSYASPKDLEGVKSLQLLYPDYIDNTALFSCPSAPSKHREIAGTVTADSCSYDYDCRHHSSHSSSVVIVSDHKSATSSASQNHKGRVVIVGYMDGRAIRKRIPTSGKVKTDLDDNGIWTEASPPVKTGTFLKP